MSTAGIVGGVAAALLILFALYRAVGIVQIISRKLERRAQARNPSKAPTATTPSEALARAARNAHAGPTIIVPLSTLRANLPGRRGSSERHDGQEGSNNNGGSENNATVAGTLVGATVVEMEVSRVEELPTYEERSTDIVLIPSRDNNAEEQGVIITVPGQPEPPTYSPPTSI